MRCRELLAFGGPDQLRSTIHGAGTSFVLDAGWLPITTDEPRCSAVARRDPMLENAVDTIADIGT